MEIYNTLTRKKEAFKPRKDKKVQMFVCGPTVYDYIHIGNARTFVFFDVVAKYLKYKGYDVDYIQNITDIDNKIIERAQKEGVDPLEYAKKYSDIFKEDMRALGVTAPEYKNATDHIPEVIKQVQTLLNKGNAYIIENDGIYFDLSTFPDYGKLSGRTAGMANDAVSRIDDSDKKRNRGDFALWKFSQAGDPSWPAPFGVPGVGSQALLGNSAGRPGWHIEDTAITEKYFGPQYDIHGGGEDLKFPHHEAEIAQQESASGLKPFVKYWMHSGFLINKESKMSKSLGNFQTARELLKKYSKETLRLYLLSSHYRSPLEFSEEIIEQYQNRVNKLRDFYLRIMFVKNKIEKGDTSAQHDPIYTHIEDAMDNDFNTSDAFKYISEDLIDEYSKSLFTASFSRIKQIEESVNFINNIFGIIPTQERKIPKEVSELVESRKKYRQGSDWKKADELRQEIKNLGYEVEDTVYGPLVTLH